MSSAADRNFSAEQAAQAAAAWVLRCDRGLTAAEQDEFSQWLAADPRHGEQLARHRRHWDRLAPLAYWRPEHGRRPNPDLLAPPRHRAVRFFPAAAALAVAACIALVFVMGGKQRAVTPAVAGPTVVVREPAATRRILDDGTVVELNRGAELIVRFSPLERRVWLERGEAHFSVTKNPSRPFVVSVRGMDVRAVGTAFNVRLEASAIEVLVTEGRVRVEETQSASMPEAAPLVSSLEAGQRAVVSLAARAEAPRIAALTVGEIERVLAWQHRMFDFTAVPLGEVVAEFNRHNRVRLTVADAELAAVPLSASFRSDNIEGFVRLVEMGFGARAERRSDGEIVLRKAP